MQSLPRNWLMLICFADRAGWERLLVIRVEGSITEDTRREARVAITEGNTASLSSMYTIDDNLIAVFAFDNGIATIYSFSDEPKEINSN